MKKQRIDRIHAVVQTPCLIDRLVEFVADKTSEELLVTEASVCLAAIVCSDDYNEDHIDEILRCVVDRGVCAIFLERVTTLVGAMDERALKPEDLPAYLQIQDDVDGDGIIDEDAGSDSATPTTATTPMPLKRMGRTASNNTLGGGVNNTHLIDYTQVANADLVVKCHLGHVCPFEAVANASMMFCDTCGDQTGDDNDVCFACIQCEFSLCHECLNKEKLPNAPRSHLSTSRPGTVPTPMSPSAFSVVPTPPKDIMLDSFHVNPSR